MDKYKAMPAFQADATVITTENDKPIGPTALRSIRYAAPNRFEVQVKVGPDLVLKTVSNGEKLVEYSNQSDITPVSYPAPGGISEASTMAMRHPMVCGSLLYQFFGGSANIQGLVNESKAPITYGEELSGDGEMARVVHFYATQGYGNTEALIGEKSGRVYRISYDSAPLLDLIKQTHRIAPEIALRGDVKTPEVEIPTPGAASELSAHRSTEVYDNIKTGSSVASAPFDVTIPRGRVAVEMPDAPSDAPPVSIGSPAPDIEVTGLDGKPVRLSSLRGHVVFLDFWATWCPPCRKGLPETAHLAQAGEPSGLRVLAVSGEERSSVEQFLKPQSYKLPVYLDSSGAAAKAFRADAIPTTAVIDAQGNLSAYYVGLQDAATIEKAIKNAGAQLTG